MVGSVDGGSNPPKYFSHSLTDAGFTGTIGVALYDCSSQNKLQPAVNVPPVADCGFEVRWLICTDVGATGDVNRLGFNATCEYWTRQDHVQVFFFNFLNDASIALAIGLRGLYPGWW